MPALHLFKIGLALCVSATLVHADHIAPADQLVTLPLEQLMQFQVDSVSRHPQKVATAPASISIVTAHDIKAFGYRTLAEILDSMRGLYVSDDRNYSYLGVRGFSTPGDYNTRVAMLVDGVRYSDDVFDQVAIGTDFSVDTDLIERVEFIAGPASAVYGSNALLGVINIITKTGADFRGTNISGSAGNYGASKARATLGDATASGGSWLVSATRFNVSGQDLYYREYDTPEQNYGDADAADYDRGTTLLAKYKQDGLALTLTHGDRTKGIPTASFEQTFNDNRSQTVDTRTHLGLQYQHKLTAATQVVARLYGGRYAYQGNYIYNDSLLENRDKTDTEWVGGELQTVWSGSDWQTIMVGSEYRYAPHVDQKNYDVEPRLVLLNDRRDSDAIGIYIQDELALTSQLALNIGGRADRLRTGDWVGSPRLGGVYQPAADTSIKLLYGTAYRTPNAYEQYYFPQFFQASGRSDSDDSDLRRERISSKELVVEHSLDRSQRIGISVFQNDIDDLISQRENPNNGALFFANDMDAQTRGAELEWQHAWVSGVRLQAAYTWQQSHDTNSHTLLNSPQHLLKLNLSGTLWHTLSYGVNVRALSQRKALRGDVPGYGVVDLTARAPVADQLEFSASLYNLFDRQYSDPGSAEHLQQLLPRNERNFVFRVDYWL